MEHPQLLFLKPRTKTTIPGHNKLPFSKRQINNGQTISKNEQAHLIMGIYFTSKLISRKTKKLRARNNTVNQQIYQNNATSTCLHQDKKEIYIDGDKRHSNSKLSQKINKKHCKYKNFLEKRLKYRNLAHFVTNSSTR